MKITDINNELLGKRVKCITIGEKREGTIIDILEEKDPVTGKVCSKGLKIKLDKPVQWGGDSYPEAESMARVSDNFGNLNLTELI